MDIQVFGGQRFARDAAVPNASGVEDATLQSRLEPIGLCLARSFAGLVPAIGDVCVNPDWYAALPNDVAETEVLNLTKPDYWRTFLSEAENH